jgi:hypothetical protein
VHPPNTSNQDGVIGRQAEFLVIIAVDGDHTVFNVGLKFKKPLIAPHRRRQDMCLPAQVNKQRLTANLKTQCLTQLLNLLLAGVIALSRVSFLQFSKQIQCFTKGIKGLKVTIIYQPDDKCCQALPESLPPIRITTVDPLRPFASI